MTPYKTKMNDNNIAYNTRCTDSLQRCNINKLNDNLFNESIKKLKLLIVKKL